MGSKKDFVAIAGNCLSGYQRHWFFGDLRCLRCGKFKPKKGKLYCHRCGYKKIILESLAEGHCCPNCGSSDSDE